MNLLDLVVSISAEDKASAQIESVSTKSVAMGTAIGTTLGGLVSTGIQQAAGFIVDFGKQSIEAGMSFDSAMSQVAATMGLTTNDIGDLTACAKEMGASTAFSATQAAEGLNYMALAGYSSEEAIATLPTVLNLAAAGSMELGAASDMVTDAQTALGLSLEETTVLVDQMAQTSSKSNTSVSQLGSAILQIGGTARNLSGGVTEMNTVLGVLADNGIKGAEAGTHLRNIILSLSAPTDKAASMLKYLDVSATDAQGNLRPLPDIMRDLNMSMESLTQEEKTQALATIFNKTDLSSVNALLSTAANNVDDIARALVDTGVSFRYFDDDLDIFEQAEGMALAVSEAIGIMGGNYEDAAQLISEQFDLSLEDSMKLIEAGGAVMENTTDRFDELAAAIEDSAGAAEQMAQVQLDNLAGDMTLLESATEGVQLELAAGATPALREMVQTGSAGLSEMAAKLQGGDIVGGFEQIGQTVTEVASVFLRSLPQFVDAGMKMLAGFIKGFGEGLPQMIPAIVEAVVGIANALVQNLPLLIEAAGQLVVGLAQGLIQAIPVLIEAIPQLIQSIITALIGSAAQLIVAGVELFIALVQAIPVVIPALIEALPQIIEAIVNGLIEAAPLVMEAGVQILQALANSISEGAGEWIPQAIDSIVEFFSELPGKIGEWLAQVVSDIVQWASELGENGGEAGTQFVEGVIKFITELPGKIAGFLNEIISKVGTWVSEMAEKAQKAGSEFLNKVVEFITQLPGRIAENLNEIINNVGSWVSEMIDKAQEAGSEFLENVSTKIGELPGEIAGFCGEIIGSVSGWVSDMGAKAAEAGAEFFSAVDQKFGEVVSFFAELPGRIISAIGNAGSMLSNVGRQIIQGLIGGIKSMVSSAISAVTSALSGIVSAAKSFLGIASPSKLFKGIGIFSMQGLGVGFEDGADEATETLDDVLDDMSNKSVAIGVSSKGLAGGGAVERSFVFDVTINAASDAVNYGRMIGESLYQEYARLERRAI